MKLNEVKRKSCPQCPYKLGIIKTLINPCPQCKMNGYSSYEWFLKLPWQGRSPKNRDK